LGLNPDPFTMTVSPFFRPVAGVTVNFGDATPDALWAAIRLGPSRIDIVATTVTPIRMVRARSITLLQSLESRGENIDYPH
jgi:hypothetical protein